LVSLTPHPKLVDFDDVVVSLGDIFSANTKEEFLRDQQKGKG
jgi:hypothetical protein